MANEPQKRILIVDDDPAVVELLRLALPEYEIQAVGDAESALATAPAFQPDLFIVDLVLPGMRGTSLALLLRDSPLFAETPIFLLSGHIEPVSEDGEPLRVGGYTGFPKPFKIEALRKHVRLHLAGAESGQAALQRLARGWISGE